MTDFVSPGYVTLKEAVDLTGRHLFDTAWTGKEIRQLRFPAPKRSLRRLESAVHELRSLLAGGKVSAIALAKNGQTFSVPTALWLSQDGRAVFNTGILPPGNLRESLRARQEGTLIRQISVPKIDLEDALSFGRVTTKTEPTAGIPVDEYRTGFPGRPPKIRQLIEQEFRRRCEAGEVCSTLAEEARALQQWAKSHHPRASTPAEKTITNNIRNPYRANARNTAQN